MVRFVRRPQREIKERVIKDSELEKIQGCGCASRAVRKLMAKELLEWRRGKRTTGG